MTDKTGISIKAVVLGFLTDSGGSIVVGIAYGLVICIGLLIKGVPPDKIVTHLHGPVIEIPSLFFGFGCTLLGGYVAGRIAKHSEILHGGLVGALGIPLGFLVCGSLPLWVNIVTFAGLVPAGLLGGHLAKQKHQKPNDVQPSAPPEATRP